MITLPAKFAAAINPYAIGSRHVKPVFVLQIGGLPTAYVYGSDSVDFTPATFWDGEDAWKVPAATKRSFRIDPKTGLPAVLQLSGSELDILEGRADMGTLNVELVDKDNELAQLQAIRRQDGWKRLKTTIGRWETDDIELESVSGLSVGNVIYIDREAMRIESIDTGAKKITVTRGWFRSVAERHGGSDKYGSARGAVVTLYPRALDERPVWLWYGLSPTKLSDCVRVFAGQIRDYGNDGLTVALNCEDGQARLKRPLFWDIGEGWYEDPAAKGPNRPTVTVVGSDQVATAGGALTWIPSTWPLRTAGDRFLTAVGQYVSWLEVTGSFDIPGQTFVYFKPRKSGVWARYFQTEPGPRAASPVILISASSSDTTQPESDLPWLASHTSESTGISGYHPLLYVLQILTSTGRYYETDGDMTGQNSDFDVLPESWGMGIPAEDIDIDGILRIARRTSELKMRMMVMEIVDSAREWLAEQFLKPFGFYLNLSADGKIAIGSLEEPSPDERLNLPTIDINDIVLDPGSKQPKTLKGPISQGRQRAAAVNLKDTPRLKDGKLTLLRERTITVSEDEAMSKSADPVDIASYGLTSPNELVEISTLQLNDADQNNISIGRLPQDETYRDSVAAMTEPPGARHGRDYIARLLSLYQPRYALPPHVVTVKVRPRLWALGLGARVSVSLPHLANPYSTARGWNGVTCEVTKRNADPLTGDIELELSASMLSLMATRYVAPALKITTWDTDTLTATVEANAFTAPGTYDTAPFAVGWPVRVYSGNRLKRSQAVLVTAKTNTSVTFSAVPVLDLGGGALDGGVITLAPYGEALPAMKARYAYRAATPPDLTLGGTDQPHTFS